MVLSCLRGMIDAGCGRALPLDTRVRLFEARASFSDRTYLHS